MKNEVAEINFSVAKFRCSVSFLSHFLIFKLQREILKNVKSVEINPSVGY